jgi:hypothetical protein
VLARFILWRLCELAAVAFAISAVGWILDGGPRALLHGHASVTLGGVVHRQLAWLGAALPHGAQVLSIAAGATGLMCAGILGSRVSARRGRRYVRLRVAPFRTDQASVESLVGMYESLHKRLLHRWRRRLFLGQPSFSLELHRAAAGELWFAIACPVGSERMVESAFRGAYPNSSLTRSRVWPGSPPALLRLRKRGEFIKRVCRLDPFALERDPPINRTMRVLAACPGPAYLQIALTPAPTALERYAGAAFKRHERRVSKPRDPLSRVAERSLFDLEELKGGLELQHRSLFFADIRVVSSDRIQARRIASELRAQAAENSLVVRELGARRRSIGGGYDRRLARGEGNPLPPLRRGLLASTELAALWHLPSLDNHAIPFWRHSVPVAPAPPGILRPRHGGGLLRDDLGPVSVHTEMRRQNTAVPGAVEQGKSSYLVASVAEDVRRDRCAVVLLDPKGDAADAALSAVPPDRVCTLLDFAHPTCGFNPLGVKAPPDVVADHVVAALRNMFSEADIRASSDRFMRNAIIAVLANDAQATLWDAARLLSVGSQGDAYRAYVSSRVRAIPALKEISEFFATELGIQLADSRSMTTAKLDAPANKLARLLNSPSIKRALLNRSLLVDFDRVIAGCEVLVVKGALGAMGAGNTSVLMQMLMGMLDAALARQQDKVPADKRVAVALKIDEAPLVINRGFAETLALKRSAGLETVACWQTDAQWVDREIRDQLDALFAHRVYFATASTRDARNAAGLLMAEYSDSVRPGMPGLSALGRPDARLHLPRHHAIASYCTPTGRQSPFIARTLPMRVDRARLAVHARRQAARGGRFLEDLAQPHWDRSIANPRDSSMPPTAGTAQPGPADLDVAQGRSTCERGSGRARGPEAPASFTAPADARPHASFRELVDLDGAIRLRPVPRGAAGASIELDQLDIDILEFVGAFHYALSSQLHRRFNEGRAATTTQRRLKRLSDAGLLQRLQFHRRDGAGIPMCYAVTAAGIKALVGGPPGLRRQTDSKRYGPWPYPAPSSAASGSRKHLHAELATPAKLPTEGDARAAAQVRREIHVVGWVLALERALGVGRLSIKGPEGSVLSPPLRSTASGERPLAPRDLRLPGGRAPHDFWRTSATGARTPVGRFETLRPDATVAVPRLAGSSGTDRTLRASAGGDASRFSAQRGLPGRPADVLVEFDDRIPRGREGAKLERYEHFLAGWALHTRRYGKQTGCPPVVVFVCRDRSRARECARSADLRLLACQACAGEHPWDWRYPARGLIRFCAERDIHEGNLRAYGVPPLPPEVRVALADGDPAARAADVVPRHVIPDTE